MRYALLAVICFRTSLRRSVRRGGQHAPVGAL